MDPNRISIIPDTLLYTDGAPRLASCAGLRPDAAALRDATAMLKPSRSYAFSDDPELTAFADRQRDAEMLRRFGY